MTLQFRFDFQQLCNRQYATGGRATLLDSLRYCTISRLPEMAMAERPHAGFSLPTEQVNGLHEKPSFLQPMDWLQMPLVG